MNSKSFRLAEVQSVRTSHATASARPSPDRSYSDHPPDGTSSSFHRIWPRLAVFLGDGQVEVDNNLAENAMRPVALGRKNWLHIGDETAGPKIAATLSVLATCQQLGISAREYFLDVLPRIGTSSAAGMKKLTPQA